MKLTEFNASKKFNKFNAIAESRFGVSIDYDNLTLAKAKKVSAQIFETVNTIRHSKGAHTAEKNPKYLEMLIIYEGLQNWIANQRPRRLNEDEVRQAETILAAKSLVDLVQDMIQKAGKMQNEELPALIDSIRDQLGADQATQFSSSSGEAIGELVTFLTQTREKIDLGVRELAGEQVPRPDDTGDTDAEPAEDEPKRKMRDYSDDADSEMDALPDIGQIRRSRR